MRINYKDLARMGATQDQLNAYENSVPLIVIEQDESGSYSVTGGVDDSGLSRAELLDLLQFEHDHNYVEHTYVPTWDEVFDGVIVVNGYGVEFDYNVALSYMSNEGVREKLNEELAPCTPQEFFDAYAEEYALHYGHPWVLSEENPVI